MSFGGAAAAPQPGGLAAGQAQPLGLDLSVIGKRYGDFVALDDVSLRVKPGEFLTLLGPSGSGKTTLLMTIAGFVRPEAGSVRLGDQEMVRLPPHERGIGMMFQNYALFPHMDVAQNIAYPLRLRKVGAAESARMVAEALSLVQLEGFDRRRIDALSGGQKQRVALARATVFRPRLLLMDEPLSALDKKLREQMQIELRRLHETLRMTTICVTHDQREALTMSDRVAVMRAGRLVQIGTPDELYERPADAFVADFIGESVLLPIHVAAGRALFGDTELRLRERLQDGPHVLVVRPERLALGTSSCASDPALNVFHGLVASRIYEGESALLHVDIGEGRQLRLRRLLGAGSQQPLPARGEAVTLTLHRNDTIVVPGP
ncbi:Spermidine/putrescine import ATP-binding protein PotA [Variovorax sp. PBL-E5]|nr:Spermidine/putrescine import ATP-binding protein PotA [Variovorax sp. PBL-E5]